MNEDESEEESNEAIAPRFETDPLKELWAELDPILRQFAALDPILGKFPALGLGILNDKHEIVPVQSFLEWGVFHEQIEKRRVAETTINGFWVSTVFLGINHGFGIGSPQWFETMVFREKENPPPPELDGKIEVWFRYRQWRYATWAEAVEGHEMVVETIRLGIF
jgi:hypothetical protein